MDNREKYLKFFGYEPSSCGMEKIIDCISAEIFRADYLFLAEHHRNIVKSCQFVVGDEVIEEIVRYLSKELRLLHHDLEVCINEFKEVSARYLPYSNPSHFRDIKNLSKNINTLCAEIYELSAKIEIYTKKE